MKTATENVMLKWPSPPWRGAPIVRLNLKASGVGSSNNGYHLATILKFTSRGVKRLGRVKMVLDRSMRLNTSRLAQMFSKLRKGDRLRRLLFSPSSNKALKPMSTRMYG